ncbi:MAG: sigma-54-dependent Fis family transcriptional regulator [Deltaproteobacteria bacterium]|nr:sigma-54-dependent Fis family transcriptional regulator [Deltaproteobacteria bacterium]
MARVLIVDDETKLIRLLTSLFREQGYQVRATTRAEEAEALLKEQVFDLLITDVRLPRRSGIELLQIAREAQPSIQVIVMSAYGTVSGAVEAMRLGAFDYLLKPFELEGLLLLAERALESSRLQEENTLLREEGARDRGMVASSPAMRRVTDLLDRVARTDSTVLLLGESGVGKELAARTLHERSDRRDRPFIRVNCPAIPRDLAESELFGHVRGAFTGATGPRKGKFELADKGTIFLDEIADLPLEQQAKLLQVLENHSFTPVGAADEVKVDVRVLAATNLDLQVAVNEGRFRQDLYYRLQVFPVTLPPLRERREDIPGLVEALLLRLANRLGRSELLIEDEALDLLERYPWPGNVRELRNVLERAAVLSGGERIRAEDLPADLTRPRTRAGEVDGGSFLEAVESFKQEAILEALRQTDWRKKDAAAVLGLSPRALSHYIQRYDLESYREG